MNQSKSVGIIANPASGKDIRRLIARGMVVTNQEKINSIIRMILAMDALGVRDVKIMPDTTGIGQRVIAELGSELEQVQVDILEMPYIIDTQNDTTSAARIMAEQDFSCIIVMGGDGTCRVASKGCGDVPLLPVSTGTNNVFPEMIEGTLVGMAAAVIANGTLSVDETCDQAPCLELINEAGSVVDIALVDLAAVNTHDTAARAVWDMDLVKELYLTQASPANIGLSAIGGQLQPLSTNSGKALQIILGEGGKTVLAPIAPGLLRKLSVQSYRLIDSSKPVPVRWTPCVIALDGEREVSIRKGESFSVRLNPNGPWVVNIARTLRLTAQQNHPLLAAEQLNPQYNPITKRTALSN